MGGYKGYGLALWVEILAGVLSGAAYATLTYPKAADGRPLPGNIGHFFGAWRIESFRPSDEFRAAMDDLQGLLKSAPKAEGQDRIYIPGEKEFEATEYHLREGIPINDKVAVELRSLAQELGVEYHL
jgi:LDH2 family malate/lactate/ureidoglycolate dehydrogenase